MTQIEAPANLDRWPSPAGRLVTLILTRCGLRISSALALGFDCLLHDGQGAPYLRYFNTKMRREAAVPIHADLEAANRNQQRQVLDQWPARPGAVGQDPVRHGHPDPAQRLLRPAHPEELPARQRVSDLPGLPVRAGVPARAARAAAPHAHPHPGGYRERPDPGHGDEPAGPHQPGQDDRRNRERQRTGGRRCRLTTPATSSRPRTAGPSRHASAPSPPCGAWMPPASASPSTPSAAPLASPGPGFTPSRTCAPRSSGSASGPPPLRRRRFLHSGSAHHVPRCYAASKRPPPASATWTQTTTNSTTPA